MTQYDNTNKGVLFKNDRRETDKHPDYKGSINIGGTDYWLSAWLRDGKSGEFMSLAVKPKEQMLPKQDEGARRPVGQDMDDEIPFSPEWRG